MSKKRRKSVNLEGKSQWGMILFRFRKNKLAVLGVCIIALLALLCLSAGLWLPYERVYQQTLMNRFLAPFSTATNYDGSKTFYLLGTDQLGRDLFARIIYGGRISLFAGIVSVGISMICGVTLGAIAGFVGGKVDNVIMRCCDVLMAVPNMLMSMAIVSALGQGTFKMLIALSVSGIPVHLLLSVHIPFHPYQGRP